MSTKSIKLPHLCILFTFLICSVNGNLASSVLAENSEHDQEAEIRGILSDLPSKFDLDEYLQHLVRILDLVEDDKSYIDVAFAFNLFLVNINLRLIFKLKENSIDDEVRYSLGQILQKNDKFIEYFLHSEKDSRNHNYVGVPELFYNETIWRKQLRILSGRLLKKTSFYSPKELNSIFPAFKDYAEKVSKLKHFLIDPKLLNQCMWQLLAISANDRNKLVDCEIDTPCETSVLQGADYGHEILHSLLYFIIARHARGCFVVSKKLDAELMDGICAKIYNEAEFLAYNKFQIPNLSMAQIGLCTLEGHVQFLRRTWIKELLKLTTLGGCFLQKITNVRQEVGISVISSIVDHLGDVAGGICNAYAKGIEMVMLASAIRYILETYY